MAGIGDRVKRLEEQVAELTARAQAEDDGLAAEVDDTEPEQQEPERKQCAAVGCGDGVSLLGRYCPAHQRLLALCDDAITETRRAIATADSAADPFGWETSLRGLEQARRAIVGPEADAKEPSTVTVIDEAALNYVSVDEDGKFGIGYTVTKTHEEPAPVATVGVQCPRCGGIGFIVLPVGTAPCPTCLGAKIVHTHREYQALERRCLIAEEALSVAQADIGEAGDRERWLSDAEANLEMRADAKEAANHE